MMGAFISSAGGCDDEEEEDGCADGVEGESTAVVVCGEMGVEGPP